MLYRSGIEFIEPPGRVQRDHRLHRSDQIEAQSPTEQCALNLFILRCSR